MAASARTIEHVVLVIRRHVDEATFRAIINDLLAVRGNASFEATIKALALHVGVRPNEN
jgi:hypothetical protein